MTNKPEINTGGFIDVGKSVEKSPLPLNPLLYPLDLESVSSIGVFRGVVNEMINKNEGILPILIDNPKVQSLPNKSLFFSRINVKFEVDENK
jgi:hypothetical protein